MCVCVWMCVCVGGCVGVGVGVCCVCCRWQLEVDYAER
jgi:hypothetical protein